MASVYMRLSESHVVPRLPLYSVPVCTLQKAQGHKGETGAGYVDVMQPCAVGRTGIAEVPASIHPIASNVPTAGYFGAVPIGHKDYLLTYCARHKGGCADEKGVNQSPDALWLVYPSDSVPRWGLSRASTFELERCSRDRHHAWKVMYDGRSPWRSGRLRLEGGESSIRLAMLGTCRPCVRSSECPELHYTGTLRMSMSMSMSTPWPMHAWESESSELAAGPSRA